MNAASERQADADQALALARVRSIRKFYLHLAHYALVIAFLALVNLFTSPRDLWVGWVALAWGLAIALRALRVFGKSAFLDSNWEKRQIEKYLKAKV